MWASVGISVSSCTDKIDLKLSVPLLIPRRLARTFQHPSVYVYWKSDSEATKTRLGHRRATLWSLGVNHQAVTANFQLDLHRYFISACWQPRHVVRIRRLTRPSVQRYLTGCCRLESHTSVWWYGPPWTGPSQLPGVSVLLLDAW
jgi:hypothetical protein